jgi:AAA family ATP:ADP antiporter
MTIELRLHRRRHELLQGGLLGTYLFLSVTSTVIGKAVRDALFLSHFTALQMTYADLQTLVVIGIAMGVYFRAHRSLTLRRLLISTSVLFAIGDAACWWAATFHHAWLTRGIYYWLGTQAAITLPHASMLAGQTLTTRQAKRVLGLIGTGAIFGWIAGGFVTTATAGRVGTEALLLVMAAMTAASSPLILGVFRTFDTADIDRRQVDPLASAPGLFRSASLVWGSRHLRAVASLVFLSSVVTTIAGLQFKAIASQSIGSTDRLTAFLGMFSFEAGLAALVVQFLCTSRILQYFGAGIGLVIAPVALATGSVGVLIWGTLSTAVFLKGSDHVLRHSIDRAALDMLYVPLSQSETLQGKTFIEAVVYRMGDGVGTLAAAFGATVLHLSFSSLSIISLGFVAAWIAAVLQARHGYVERLLATLRQHTEAAGRKRAKARPFRPDQRERSEPLATELAAEIVGLYRLVHMSKPLGSNVAATPEYKETVERIVWLLELVAPEKDPLSALAALESGDPRLKANGIEYLDAILKPEYRKFLVPLLELES